MLKKGTFLQSLLIVFAMGMALLLPQNVCADGGSWTHKDGDTRCGTCGVNSNITIDFNTLNNTAWGDYSVTDRDDLSVTGCQGTRFSGSAVSKEAKLMSISIYSQSNTIPSYCKLVRTSTFCTYMATNRYRHGASIYLFDTEDAAKSTKLDAMPDQNATPDATPILKSTDNDGTHTKNQTTTTVIYDNSTGSGSRTFTKYLSFIHVNYSAENKDKEGEEWAGFIESSYSNSWIYYATISYNSNGGSGSMSSTSITGSGSLSSCAFTSPNPGYKYFKCWNTRSDGTGTSYAANETFSTSESVKGPITLYAIWGDCTFDSDGIFTSASGEKYYQPATKNSSNVYEITNKGKMMWFSQNAGSLYNQSFALTTDINMSGLPYISPFYATSYDNLSYNKSTITQEGFKGIFDGKGHTISNMSVPYANGRYSAGIVGNNSGTIKNVIMYNFTYNNGGSFDGRYGAICGVNFGTVENCGVVNSLVRVDNKICGAMVGANYGGTINNSFAKGCTVTADGRVGYLVGDNCNDDSSLKGKIVNCYVDGNRLQGTQYGASCTGDSIISATRFKSGEICYKLNGSVNGGTTWYQVINSDEYPKLLKSGTTNTVYYGYEHCGSTSKTYSNSSRYTSKPNHGSISVSGSYYTATYSNWSGTWDAPTCNFSLKCTKCNQQVLTDAKLTPSTTYAYGSLTQTAKVDAKCQATGSRTLKAKGYYPGATGYNSYTEASDKYTKTYTIPSLGHGTTGYTESYSWSGTCYNDSTKDTKSCKFTLTCKACSLNVVSGKYLTPTLKAHTDADCLTTGSTTYQATGTYSAAGSQSYSATKTHDYTVAALGHGSTGYTESYTWAGTCYNDPTQDTPACTFTLTCKKCSVDVVSEESLTPTFKWHTDAGCTNTGSTTYQATGTYTATGSKDYSATKTNDYTIAAIGHNYGTDGICTLCHAKPLCFTAEVAGAKVALKKQGEPNAISLIYSINGGTTWNDYTIGSEITLANKGDKMYMCAKDVNATFNEDTYTKYYFSLSDKTAASGDVTTLLNSHGTMSVPENAFIELFRSTALTTAPELPAASMGTKCYYSMFSQCSSLNSITVNFTDWNTANSSATFFLYEVAPSGTFICPEGLDTDAMDKYNNRYVPAGWTVIRRCVNGEHTVGAYHEYAIANCTEDGNKEYWECENCEMVYVADEEGNKHEEILTNVVFPKKGHVFAEDGNGFCSNCNGYQPATAVYNTDGTAIDHYAIANAGQLYWFADSVNNANRNYNKAHAKLTADIVVNKNVLNADGSLTTNVSNLRKWIPIGDTQSHSYEGEFDGNNFTISGLYYVDESNNNNADSGLFGFYRSGYLHNLTIKDSHFEGAGKIGAFCGFKYTGRIDNCSAIGISLKGTNTSTIGGLVAGGYYGKIYNSFSANLYINSTSEKISGIMATSYQGTVRNCYTTYGNDDTDAFYNGEIAWLLNGSVDDNGTWTAGKSDGSQAWYQKIDTDVLPKLLSDDKNSETVRCMFGSYTNSSTAEVELNKVGEHYFTSLYTDFPYTVAEADRAMFHSANCQDDKMVLTSISQNTVPASTALILRNGSSQQKVTLTYVDDASQVTAISSDLTGSATPVTASASDYAFAVSQGMIGLYGWEGRQIPAWKAYYHAADVSNAAPRLVFADLDETTAITTAVSAADDNVTYYSIDGRRMAQPRGITIVRDANGKTRKMIKSRR